MSGYCFYLQNKDGLYYAEKGPVTWAPLSAASRFGTWEEASVKRAHLPTSLQLKILSDASIAQLDKFTAELADDPVHQQMLALRDQLRAEHDAKQAELDQRNVNLRAEIKRMVKAINMLRMHVTNKEKKLLSLAPIRPLTRRLAALEQRIRNREHSLKVQFTKAAAALAKREAARALKI